jgi:hypothetical protein
MCVGRRLTNSHAIDYLITTNVVVAMIVTSRFRLKEEHPHMAAKLTVFIKKATNLRAADVRKSDPFAVRTRI